MIGEMTLLFLIEFNKFDFELICNVLCKKKKDTSALFAAKATSLSLFFLVLCVESADKLSLTPKCCSV